MSYRIDVLRGFAVLGILIINIQLYSMIEAAYFNPKSYGDLNDTNWLVWLYSHIFADTKFIGIFSLLFGAGVLLFTGKAEAKGAKVAGLHYRRPLWLLLFGILHGYCLWNGDILFAYGICALLVFPFRRISPVKLLVIGLLIVSISSGLYLLTGHSMHMLPPKAVENMSLEFWDPEDARIDHELDAYRGSYKEQMMHRVPPLPMMQMAALLLLLLWRCGGLMLIVMALLKWGVLSANSNKLLDIVFIEFLALILPEVSRI